MSIHPSRRLARGVAAVEFAILLPLLVILLSMPLYLGRVMWHYTAAQKSAHDAAQYLASIPDADMRSPILAPPAAAVARDLISAELADLNYGDYPPLVTILCDGTVCGGYTVPTMVSVNVQMRVQDPFFGIAFGDDGFLISADSQMLYIGSQ
jgi:Flp pilus assembly protein TadG